MKKIIFEDNGASKRINGKIIKEDEFTYEIQTEHDEMIIIGKRNLVMMREV